MSFHVSMLIKVGSYFVLMIFLTCPSPVTSPLHQSLQQRDDHNDHYHHLHYERPANTKGPGKFLHRLMFLYSSSIFRYCYDNDKATGMMTATSHLHYEPPSPNH